MNARSFHLIFKKLRSEKNMTQREIAAALGVSVSLIAMWETGQRLPSPDLYEQIADYFNVDIDYLYGRSGVRRMISFDADGHELRSLTPDQEDLLRSYEQLNASGKEKVREYAADLSEQKKYTKDTALPGEKMA